MDAGHLSSVGVIGGPLSRVASEDECVVPQ